MRSQFATIGTIFCVGLSAQGLTRFLRAGCCCCVFSFIAGAPGSALSSQLAATWSLPVDSGKATFSAQDFVAGWRFDVSQAIEVDGLGVWSRFNALNEAHPVGIWTDAGSLVTSATVPGGVDVLLRDIQLVSITPVILNPGRYRIAAYYSETNNDGIITNPWNPFFIPEISFVDRTSQVEAGGLVFPERTTSISGAYGPNFTATPVPEPSTVTLAAMALVGLLAVGWRRRNR